MLVNLDLKKKSRNHMMIHTLGKFTEMNVDTHELLNTGR